MSFYHLWPDMYGNLATFESFRRYRLWYQFAFLSFGIPNVSSSAIIRPDYRFLNPFNFMVQYYNAPLIDTIRKYWNDREQPIKTGEGNTRLLVVAVGAQGATTATFE
ncbi:MAG: hypothetical protein WKF36_06520 [Candidatus Nitrosocosmicus sp.]